MTVEKIEENRVYVVMGEEGMGLKLWINNEMLAQYGVNIKELEVGKEIKMK